VIALISVTLRSCSPIEPLPTLIRSPVVIDVCAEINAVWAKLQATSVCDSTLAFGVGVINPPTELFEEIWIPVAFEKITVNIVLFVKPVGAVLPAAVKYLTLVPLAIKLLAKVIKPLALMPVLTLNVVVLPVIVTVSAVELATNSPV